MDPETQDVRGRLRTLSAQIDNLFDLGKKEEGAQLLREGLAVSEGDQAYHLFFKGEEAVYLKKNRRLQKECLLKAEQLDGQDPFIVKNVGVFYLLNDAERKAIKYFDRVIELDPEDYEAYRHKGLAFSNLGRETRGMEWFLKSIEKNPSDYDAMRQIGVSLSKLGEDRAAIDWFKKALAVNEADYDSIRQLGISLAMIGQYDAAIDCLQLALTVNPGDFESKRNLTLVMKKKSGEGDTLLNRLLNFIGRKVYYGWRLFLNRL